MTCTLSTFHLRTSSGYDLTLGCIDQPCNKIVFTDYKHLHGSFLGKFSHLTERGIITKLKRMPDVSMLCMGDLKKLVANHGDVVRCMEVSAIIHVVCFHVVWELFWMICLLYALLDENNTNMHAFVCVYEGWFRFGQQANMPRPFPVVPTGQDMHVCH